MSRGSILASSVQDITPIFPNQEQEFENAGATVFSARATPTFKSKKKKPSNEVGDKLTGHRNGIPMFKGTNDEKSGVENRQKSKKKKRKAIQDEAVQEKIKKG